MKMDKSGMLKFTDIENNYNVNDPINANVSYEEAMKKICAVYSNGEIITGVNVFKEMYETIGLGFLFSFYRIPVLRNIAESAYLFWAKYRTNITRNESLDALVVRRNKELEEKMKKFGNDECSDRCERNKASEETINAFTDIVPSKK